jgi:hypothetical protein
MKRPPKLLWQRKRHLELSEIALMKLCPLSLDIMTLFLERSGKLSARSIASYNLLPKTLFDVCEAIRVTAKGYTKEKIYSLVVCLIREQKHHRALRNLSRNLLIDSFLSTVLIPPIRFFLLVSLSRSLATDSRISAVLRQSSKHLVPEGELTGRSFKLWIGSTSRSTRLSISISSKRYLMSAGGFFNGIPEIFEFHNAISHLDGERSNPQATGNYPKFRHTLFRTNLRLLKRLEKYCGSGSLCLLCLGNPKILVEEIVSAKLVTGEVESLRNK